MLEPDKLYDRIINQLKIDAEMPRRYADLNYDQQVLIDTICEECYNEYLNNTSLGSIERMLEDIAFSVEEIEDSVAYLKRDIKRSK
jgi:hypothetical protein